MVAIGWLCLFQLVGFTRNKMEKDVMAMLWWVLICWCQQVFGGGSPDWCSSRLLPTELKGVFPVSALGWILPLLFSVFLFNLLPILFLSVKLFHYGWQFFTIFWVCFLMLFSLSQTISTGYDGSLFFGVLSLLVFSLSNCLCYICSLPIFY